MKILSLTTAHPGNDSRICRFHNSYHQFGTAKLFSSLSRVRDGEFLLADYFSKRVLYLSFRLYLLLNALIVIVRFRPRLLHVHDPDLYIAAALLSRSTHIHVLIDVHELYKTRFHRFNLLLANYFSEPQRCQFLTAGHDISEYLTRCFSIQSSVFPNYPCRPSKDQQRQSSNNLINQFTRSNRFKIFFTGGYSAKRCLGPFLSSLELIDRNLELSVLVCGNGSVQKDLPFYYSISPSVEIYKFSLLPYCDVEFVNYAANLAICLFTDEPNHQCIRSNRFYEALSHNNMVIVSDFGEWSTFAASSDIVFCCNQESPHSIACAIQHAARVCPTDSGLNNYTWESQENKLASLLGMILTP